MGSIEIPKATLVEQLMMDLKYKAQRVRTALDDMKHLVERVEQSLATGYSVSNYTVEDNPAKLLADMDATVKLLLQLGVPLEAVLTARRGEFTSPMTWGLTEAEIAEVS